MTRRSLERRLRALVSDLSLSLGKFPRRADELIELSFAPARGPEDIAASARDAAGHIETWIELVDGVDVDRAGIEIRLVAADALRRDTDPAADSSPSPWIELRRPIEVSSSSAPIAASTELGPFITDARGHAVIDGLEPGRAYRVEVNVPGAEAHSPIEGLTAELVSLARGHSAKPVTLPVLVPAGKVAAPRPPQGALPVPPQGAREASDAPPPIATGGGLELRMRSSANEVLRIDIREESPGSAELDPGPAVAVPRAAGFAIVDFTDPASGDIVRSVIVPLLRPADGEVARGHACLLESESLAGRSFSISIRVLSAGERARFAIDGASESELDDDGRRLRDAIRTARAERELRGEADEAMLDALERSFG
jgi:hypothetical protein